MENPRPFLLVIAVVFYWYQTVTLFHSSVQHNVITNVNNTIVNNTTISDVITNVNNTNMSDGDIDNQNPFVPRVIPEELLLLDDVELSLLHPWERDARLIEKAIKKGPKHYSIIVEIICTRSSSELLGARKAYYSLFNRSMEEDIAAKIQGSENKLLLALVSAYRYEGPKVNEDVEKSEAEILSKAIKNIHYNRNDLRQQFICNALLNRCLRCFS